LLTFSRNNVKISIKLIQAVPFYLINVYPEAIKLCQSLDQLSDQISRGEPSSNLDPIILERFGLYTQRDEKARHDYRKGWIIPSPPRKSNLLREREESRSRSQVAGFQLPQTWKRTARRKGRRKDEQTWQNRKIAR
jgi:hypothetical protein